MIIRAIDPGPIESAYCDWDGEKIWNCGIFQNRHHHNDLDNVKPIKAVYIEMVGSYGMAVGSEVFETAFWVGRFWQQYIDLGIGCTKIYRRDVRLHLCHSARAGDTEVNTAIVDRFDPYRKFGKYSKGTSKSKGMFFGFSKDMWAAFAVALTAWDKYCVNCNKEATG